MGRSFFIRDRELAFSDMFLGWVDGFWWSGANECSSKNEIRSEPLLGYVCFLLAPLFYSSVFLGLCSSCAETGYY
jgi:hypothetical protein